MNSLTVRTSTEDNLFLLSLLRKLGYWVEVEKGNDIKPDKSEINGEISPTFLFGKWKNIKLNPLNVRKKLWQRAKKY